MVGFISFVPTNYVGLSELGIISFIGLIVGLITNIFFFTSMIIFSKTSLRSENKEKENFYNKYFNLLNKRKKIFFISLFFILIFTIINFDRINFDSDALNLKDDNLESVILAKQLIEKNPTSDYIISVVLDKEDFNNQEKFEKLLNKKSIKSIFSYKDLIGSYENDELDYFKFLISSQMSDSFYSSFDELKRFQNLLKKISKLNDQNLSRESNFLLKLIEEKNY